MSLKTAIARRIEELKKSKTTEQYGESATRLTALLDGALPYLAPAPLIWDIDRNDPQVRNAIDRVLGRVWQVEELDGFSILRVFGASKELLFKEQTPVTSSLDKRIENARLSMYARDISLADALFVSPLEEGPGFAAALAEPAPSQPERPKNDEMFVYDLS